MQKALEKDEPDVARIAATAASLVDGDKQLSSAQMQEITEYFSLEIPHKYNNNSYIIGNYLANIINNC